MNQKDLPAGNLRLARRCIRGQRETRRILSVSENDYDIELSGSQSTLILRHCAMAAFLFWHPLIGCDIAMKSTQNQPLVVVIGE